MKGIFHKFISIVLIPIVLVSTTSFSVFKHECGGELYSLSITGNDDSCGMDMNTVEESCKLIPVKDIIASEKDRCCNSDTILVSGSQTNLDSEIQLSQIQLKIFKAFIATYLNLIQTDITSAINYNYYIPPITVKNIAVLYQVFKI